MTAIFLLVALATSFPSVSIQTTCRGARDAALPEDRAGAYDSCVRDEQTAKAQLQTNWTHYSASAHAACAQAGSFSFSYVELRVCLEMQPGGSLSMENAAGKPRRPPP